MVIVKYATPDMDKSLRLNIESISGAYCLFFHFNCPQMDAEKPVYWVLSFLMEHAIRTKFKKEGLDKYGDEDFYEVHNTLNDNNFCISVTHGKADNEVEALEIVKYALDYASSFETEGHTYESEEIKNRIERNLVRVKELVQIFNKEIFEEHSVEFISEYWDPLD